MLGEVFSFGRHMITQELLSLGLTDGEWKVDVQWRLFALVHNIGKIHTFGALA